MVVPDQDAILELIAAGADVTEYTKPVSGGLEVHVVATEAQQAELRARGFAVVGTVVDADQVEAVVAEREATLRELDEIAAMGVDTLTVLRSEWFESIGGETYLNVEVKTSAGADSATVLTVSWDGASYEMDRFEDADEYLCHRFNQPIPVSEIPAEVTITSSMAARPPPRWCSGWASPKGGRPALRHRVRRPRAAWRSSGAGSCRTS